MKIQHLILTALVALAALPAMAQRAPNTTAASVTKTNALPVRYSSLRIYDLTGQVYTNQDVWIQVHDRSVAITNGAYPKFVFLAFANLPFSQSWPAGRPMNSGLVVAASSTDARYTNCGPVLTLDCNYYDGN